MNFFADQTWMSVHTYKYKYN